MLTRSFATLHSPHDLFGYTLLTSLLPEVVDAVLVAGGPGNDLGENGMV